MKFKLEGLFGKPVSKPKRVKSKIIAARCVNAYCNNKAVHEFIWRNDNMQYGACKECWKTFYKDDFRVEEIV
jgi:hypothetical protein